MNVKEAAELIGCSRVTIYALEKRGVLTITRDPVLGGLPARIPLEQVVELARQRGRGDEVERILAKRHDPTP